MWSQGTNPHDVELKDNTLADELPLLVAGGYHLLHLHQKPLTGSAHHLLSILAIVAVILSGEGGEVANTLGFLVEAPSVLIALRSCVVKMDIGPLTTFFTVVSFLVNALSNLDICHMNYVILTDNAVALHMKLMMAVLSLFVWINLGQMVYSIMGGKDEEMISNQRQMHSRSSRNSRSPSRSRSLPRSRSKGSRGRRCCYNINA